MIINRPTIAQITAAPVGSIIEVWMTKEEALPKQWIKKDTLWWKSPRSLSRTNSDLNLTHNYKWRLVTEEAAQ